ncbi:MAG TPA: C25 family cysteine peptidase [Pyrinomonadaceae bacterium]|nr:C25 family cysteine peptidase [Pyrinomonadaceae bacterium]
MADKVIVTNWTALKQKYKPAGIKAIEAAVRKLIASDKTRDLKTVLIPLDDATAMKKLGATSVKDASSFRQNKVAIDGVYEALAPDYLMILGAVDVIPHQDLKNPLFTNDPDGDTDKFAYGDLPYASDAPYSQKINDFSGPTRVVGRLPDLTEQGDPRYLVNLLNTAATWKSLPRSEYETYLGISAEKWKDSTAESLTNIFNSSGDLQTSPTKGFRWKSALINRRVHFVNCHGGDTYPDFLGQSGTDDDVMPVSHQAAFVAKKGNVLEGTVVAAECCYGGQLYNPAAADDEQMGMCNTYLAMKAYGFLGSTTTAYGPFSGNDQADLICQYFLQRVLAGASLGRATLEARQRFVEKSSPLSPMNQKTLAQFNLYGDPSVVPVDTATSTLVVGPKATTLNLTAKSVAKSKSVAKAVHLAGAVERGERRELLRAKGVLLSELQPEMSKSEAATPTRVRSSLTKIMTELNLRPLAALSFKVESPAVPALIPKSPMAKGISKAVAAKKQHTTAFHVMFGLPADAGVTVVAKSVASKEGSKLKRIASKTMAKKSPIHKFVVLEAKEVDGKIVSVKEAHSK